MKKRLDLLVSEKYPQYSRQQIQSFIMQGLVFVDSKKITKSGSPISENAIIELKVTELKYVSRAGFKLEHALKTFNVNVKDLVVLDAGISTGGFTDCLLQNGAKKIYGVDVGHGQVHEKIRNDPRVVLLEKTNLRNLDFKNIGELVDLVTLDLSFISILKVMPAILKILKPEGQLITLIKPQFEAEKEEALKILKNGVIKDPEIRDQIVKKVVSGIETFGFKCVGISPSPVLGATGNQEFLSYFKRI